MLTKIKISTLIVCLWSIEALGLVLINAKDVSESHPQRNEIMAEVRQLVDAFVSGDEKAISAMSSTRFLKKVRPHLIKGSTPKSDQTAEVRNMHLVDDGSGLLVNFEYRENSKARWVHMPNGTWYRMNKSGKAWIFQDMVRDYSP